jgi:hypothetical protein
MSASGKQDGMEMQELTDDDEVRLISNPSSQSTCDINLACAIACSTREGYPAKPVSEQDTNRPAARAQETVYPAF